MIDFTMKQHDTWPPMRFTLSDANGPVDLTPAQAIKLLMKGSAVEVEGDCDPDPDQVANKGRGSYTWVVGDTATDDVYDLEFEVTWTDGTVETFPNGSYKSVEIKADLG